MPQYLRPTSVIDPTGWTTSSGTNPLYTYIDETVADDTDYIQLTGGQGNTTYFPLGLSGLQTPSVKTGHIIRLRSWAIGSGQAEQHSVLIQTLINGTYTGIANIALFATVSRTAGTQITYTLTEAEASNIVDYGTMRLQISLTGGFNSTDIYRVSWIEMEIPNGIPNRKILVT